MTAAALIERLKALQNTTQNTSGTHEKTPGVLEKSPAVIGETSPQNTRTHGTQEKPAGGKESAETGAAVQDWAPLTTPAPAQAKPPAPAPDPGHAALLALAMAYCDRTGASDKARSDWARDVQDTPPVLRGDLYAHLREQLPPVQPRPVPAPAPAPAKPATWLDVAQPWRVADAAYLAHWGQCPACQSATRHGERCPTGQQLHDAYAQAVRLTH